MSDVHLAVWHNMSEMHAVDYLHLYGLVRVPGARWGASYWVKIVPIWRRVMKDVTERLSAARIQGLIRADEEAALVEHMPWQEVDAEVPIGYSRTLRTELEP